MRLFRQPKPGDWDSVFSALATGLAELRRSSTIRYPVPVGADRRDSEHIAKALVENNRIDLAVVRLQALLVETPDSVELRNCLGVAYARQRRTADAAQQFRRAVEADARSVVGWSNLATALRELGALVEAEVALREVIRLQPDHREARFRLADLCRHQGRSAEAIEAYQSLLDAKPDDMEALNSLGILLEESGRAQEAERLYREALKKRLDAPDLHTNLGVALAAQGRWEECLACYRDAIRGNPTSAVFHNNIGNALRQLTQLDEAERHLRDATRLRPDYPEAHNNLGIVFSHKGEGRETERCYRRALELRPGYAEAHNNLGVLLNDIAGPGHAVEHFSQALALRPDYPEARLNRALAWLSLGDYERGWPEYEFRWKGKANTPRSYPNRPLWDGSDPAGKTILLHPEQGLGDSIQFLRYAKLLAQRGGRVVFEAPRPLAELAQTCPGIAAVVGASQLAPEFDYHTPLLSLPRFLGTRRPADIPSGVPYLLPDRARAAYWREELTGIEGLRVGIVWQGNPQHKGDRTRSLRLARFAPLAAVMGTRLLSLQKGFGHEQLADFAQQFDIADLGRRTADDSLADMAALVMCLDLVVCVDTAMAHLAGALGRPVWMLLSYNADWRWLRDRADTPWYPTMRLFRQPRPGDWDSVYASVATELGRAVEKRCGQRAHAMVG
jgi:Flp pilus assembly protein TadD